MGTRGRRYHAQLCASMCACCSHWSAARTCPTSGTVRLLHAAARSSPCNPPFVLAAHSSQRAVLCADRQTRTCAADLRMLLHTHPLHTVRQFVCASSWLWVCFAPLPAGTSLLQGAFLLQYVVQQQMHVCFHRPPNPHAGHVAAVVGRQDFGWIKA